MKTANRLLLLTLLLAPLAAFAQAQPAPAAYPEWDRLSEAQRAILIEPLRDRWNTKPAERARMLEHAERWKNMPAEKRDRARHGMQRWERMAPEKRAEARALFHAMRGMEAAQRKDFLAQWRQKTPQQRTEWLKEHPAPERREP